MSVDVVLARVVLDDHTSGLYAAGLVLTKAVLFLPQFVVIVAFPTMARQGGSRGLHLAGLGLVLGTGALATLAVALLPGVALAFAGGPAYQDVRPHLWIFASLGTVLSLIQLLVYSALARSHRRAVWLVWTGLAATIVLGLRCTDVSQLAGMKLGVDIVLLVVLLLVLVRPSGGSDQPTADPSHTLLEEPLREDPSLAGTAGRPVSDFEAAWLRADTVPGWFTFEQARCAWDLVREAPAGAQVVESAVTAVAARSFSGPRRVRRALGSPRSTRCSRTGDMAIPGFERISSTISPPAGWRMW